VYQFSSELELSTFQADYAQRLVSTGFRFEAFREDRRGCSDRRARFRGADRRRAADQEQTLSALEPAGRHWRL
jgi:hypothetical protein